MDEKNIAGNSGKKERFSIVEFSLIMFVKFTICALLSLPISTIGFFVYYLFAVIIWEMPDFYGFSHYEVAIYGWILISTLLLIYFSMKNDKNSSGAV